MESEALSPGVGCTPAPLNAAPSAAVASCTLESSDESHPVSDLQAEDQDPKTAGRTPKIKSSAFDSSLTWDSDSEKDAPDEEELQQFCNPHGLAAHSPGSPPGLKLNGGENESQPKPKDDRPSTNGGDLTSSQPGQTELSDSRVGNVPEEAELLLSDMKPKDGSQTEEEEEEENNEGEKSPEETETKDQDRDVYSFPGDSDPESPARAPWAHCTLVQKSRKKNVLLRPFSGLGPLTEPKDSPTKSEPSGPDVAAMDVEEEVYFKGTEGNEEEGGSGQEVYTCVECSIYFNKQIHLQEHMAEHRSGGDPEKEFRCVECGWSLPDQPALEDHHQKHQESRVKIQEEIEKLNQNGKVKESDSNPESVGPVVVERESEEAVFVAPDMEQAPVDPAESAPAPTRAQPAYRRRFICPVCNFSVRTPQALANHAKTHNRKKVPNSRSSLASLACGHCAFMTYSRMVLREHQRRVHPELSRQSGGPESEESEEGQADPPVAGANARAGRRGKGWTQTDREADAEPQEEPSSPPGGKSTARASRLTRARSNSGGGSENKQAKVEKVFFLRSRNRVINAPIEVDSDDDDDDDDEDDEATNQRVRQFLSEQGFSDDEDDLEALKSVERKCPYCPEHFHNGIGLANHVRGHLNRVGVSYNVRHFISPEEVKAIERKFSYQKKKKKVANFDPDTFSVMHCEFCSAGFDTRAGLSSHARAHLRDFGITNWDVSISPIHILRELFSRRPDLVIPTDPPRSSASVQEVSDEENGLDDDDDEEEDEEEEEEEEEEAVTEIKLEMNERTLSEDGDEEEEPPSVPDPWTDDVTKFEGEEEDAAEEEDGIKVYPRDEADIKVNGWKCEVCGSRFSSRRGMSIHARSHLRQLGIGVSDGRAAPIELLYQIAKEHNLGKLSSSLLDAAGKSPGKDEDDMDVKPIALPILAAAVVAPPSSSSSSTPSRSPRASPALTHSSSPSSVVRKAPISSLLPVSSPLRSSEHKVGGIKSLTSSMSSAKPLWAPQESDAPLNLALDEDPSGDIVCQLCGAWFETRKGLSSHARAHLRHFGVEYSESKGSPINLLSQLMDSDDFKHRAGIMQLDPEQSAAALASPKQPLLRLSSSSSSSSSSLLYKVTAAGSGSSSRSTSSSSYVPPAKRLKTSSMQVFRLSSGELMAVPHSDPPKEIACEFCGEYFENRKGLSSHARSHLRQMGITEWSVNGSPIDTLRETITRRGLPCVLPLKTHKTPPPSSPGPPRSPLSTSSSPSASLLSRLPFAFARPSSPAKSAASKSSSATSSGGLVLKVKPEPEQVEVTTPGTVGRSGHFSAETLNCSWNTNSVFPLNLAKTHEIEPTRDIRCDFCGEYFENRKGLSSHARSHLRQMGITEWSVNGSPIDTLREVMHKRGLSPQSDKNVKTESTKSPRWENSAEGLTFSAYPASKFRKSPLSLVPLGSRLHKQGMLSAAAPSGKFFRTSPLGKRPQSEETLSSESTPHQLKTFSPLPQDFSAKKKPTPDKHIRQDPSCELCGFYFENRKALASHARAHLRQFGVTEWCVNGSPIETLSAWIRSRPQKVLEMHRSYMQGNRTPVKKKSSASHWSSSLPVSLVRPLSREVTRGTSGAAEDEADAGPRVQAGAGSRSPSQLADGLPPQAQVARSELNVRLPRGFERRPLKHPSCTDGTERDCGPPKPPRSSTVPALVPKPPSYPLVKLVGKFYTLKCRFCEVEFHGPLSVQEDWIRHLQQHILKMNSNKPAEPKETPGDRDDSVQPEAPPSTSTQTTTSNSPPSTPPIQLVKVSGGQPTLKPLPPQTA